MTLTTRVSTYFLAVLAGVLAAFSATLFLMSRSYLYRQTDDQLQSALGILVDVLAALLADDEADDPGRLGSNLAMLALTTDASFAGRAAAMGTYLRTSPPIDPSRPVLLPGERERVAVEQLGEGALPVDGPT